MKNANRFFAILLALLFSLGAFLACDSGSPSDAGGTTAAPGTGTKPGGTEPVASPLSVNGVDISAFKILKPFSDADENYATLQGAIAAATGCTLPFTSDRSEPYLVTIEEDYSLLPSEYFFKVAEGRLVFGIFSRYLAAPFAEAESFLTEKLAGAETVDLENGFYEAVSYELTAVDYTTLTDSDTFRVFGCTDKNPLSYGESDQITFRLSCIGGNQLVSVPYIRYVVYDDASGKTQRGVQDASSGTAVVTLEPLGKEGTLYFDALALDVNQEIVSGFPISMIDSYHFRGSVVVNLEDVAMSAAVPEDFDSFWQGELDTLYGEPIEILEMKEKTSGNADFKLFFVMLKCNVYPGETDGVVSGYLSYPVTASADEKIDLRLSFMGYSFVPATPVYTPGAATFSICAHSIDCERANDDPAYLQQQSAKDLMFNDAANYDREKSYFRGMIRRNVQAARFMAEYFGEAGIGDGAGKGMWNGTVFVAAGGSQGAYQAITVAALDKNITSLEVSNPWLCDIKGSNGKNKRRKSTFIMPYWAAMEYYDATSFGHLIRCKTSVSAAMGDCVCPFSGVVSFYNELTCEKSLVAFLNCTHGAALQSTPFSPEA